MRMNAIKRTVSAGIVFGLFGLCAVPSTHALGIGPLLGLNITNADVENHASHSVTSWAVGGRLELGMNPLFNILVDPMFVKSGADFDGTVSNPSGSGDFLFLEVPVLLSLKVSLLNLGVFGFIGPNFIFTTDASGSVPRDDVKDFTLAGDVGAGVSLGILPLTDLSLDARYTHAFTDLIDRAAGDVRHWRTRDVRLTLGLIFHTPG
jgi:hypothetical protein